MGRSQTFSLGQPDDHQGKKTEMTSLDEEKDQHVEIERVELKKELGLVGGMSFIIGVIIGSGIFISPKGVLSVTGSVGLSLIVWAGSGLIALMGALCYCELGPLIKQSGGEYTYLRLAYGNFPAFICCWVSIALMMPSSLAVSSLTFGIYFSSVFETCGSPELLVKTSAIGCMLGVLFLNCYSVKLSAALQIITTFAKVLSLFIIIVGGIYKIIEDSEKYTSELRTGFQGSSTNPSIIALAFYDALFAYGGWHTLNTMTEEVKNPAKNIPRANILSVLLVIVIYVLTNISYLAVMTREELLAADAVAVLWSDRVLHTASVVMPLSVMISVFGSLNGMAFSGGRMLFVAGRDGNLPEVLSYVNVKRNTPLTSVIFTVVFGVVFIWLGNVSSLIDFVTFLSWVFYGMTFGSIVIFRFKYKDAPRPYKVPIIIPIIMVLISIYLVIAPIVDAPDIGYLYGLIFALSASVLYVPFVHFKIKVPFADTVTTYLQLFLEVSPPTNTHEISPPTKTE